MQGARDKTVKTTLMITLIILMSKAFGFVREMIMASYFGAGVESDSYFMASGIVFVLVLLFMSCINATFVPIYIEAAYKKGRESANRYANNVLHFFVLVAIVVSVAAYLAAPYIVKLVAFGFNAHGLVLTTQLVRIMVPSFSVGVISLVFGSLLNARERFIPQQLVGFALSICLIFPILFFAKKYGIIVAAYGMVAAVLFQVLILFPFMRGYYSYLPVLDLRDDRLKQTLKLALPAVLSMAVNELNHMIDRALASNLPSGSVAALNYSFKLITFVLGVFVVPITTIMFSRMSAYAAKDDRRSIIAMVKQCAEVAALVVVPISAIAIALNTDIIRTIYQRGMFDATAVAMTSTAFMYYLTGVFFFGFRDILTRAFFALQDTKTLLKLGAISMAINIVLNIILVKVMGIGGLALAASIAAFISAGLMLLMLRKRLGKMQLMSTIGQLILITLAALFGGGTALLCKNTISMDSEILRIVVCTAAGCAAYALGVLVLGVREARKGVSQLFHRMQSKKL